MKRKEIDKPNDIKTEKRREQILKAAEGIFAEKGFSDATIGDIAKKANLSDATVYQYFSSKENVLFSIPEREVLRGKHELSLVLSHIRGATGKIRAFIYHVLSSYQNNPSLAAVIMVILHANRKFLETSAYEVVQQTYRLIIPVIEEGIASGEFKADTNPYLVRATILGAIDHLVTRWVLLGKPKDLIALVDPITDLLLKGIQNDEQTKRSDFFTLDVPYKEKKMGRATAKVTKRR